MPDPQVQTKHIAVLAFPFGTHAAPLLSLVRRLSLAAPDAKFSFFNTAQSNNSIFSKDEKWENIKSYNVDDGLPQDFVFKGNPKEPVEYFLKATPRNFKRSIEVTVEEIGSPITCLMTDAFFWFAADMAQELHVPWVPLWTAGPRSVLSHVETDLIRSKIGFSGSGETTLDFLPGFSAIRAIDLPEGIIHGDLTSPFAAMVHKMGLMLPRAAAVVANSCEDLDVTTVNMLKSRFQLFLNVGPFVLTSPSSATFSDPQGCLEWLDKQGRQSVVYISFGTVISPPPHELAALSEALEESKTPFLWSFRGDPEEKLPKGFVQRTKEIGKLVSWAPQLRILQHNATGVFVTHCGWNSVLESIVGGVPMICRPFFGDQRLNRRTVETVWGIGMEFEGGTITKDGTAKALALTLSSEEGKNMRMKLEVMKELALDAVSPNGSSSHNFKTLVEVMTK